MLAGMITQMSFVRTFEGSFSVHCIKHDIVDSQSLKLYARYLVVLFPRYFQKQFHICLQ